MVVLELATGIPIAALANVWEAADPDSVAGVILGCFPMLCEKVPRALYDWLVLALGPEVERPDMADSCDALIALGAECGVRVVRSCSEV